MSTATLSGHDLYLRRTNTAGGATLRYHRVWSSDLFLAAQQAEVDRENADVKDDGPRLASVAVITREQYLGITS